MVNTIQLLVIVLAGVSVGVADVLILHSFSEGGLKFADGVTVGTSPKIGRYL